jgi:sugar phosphate permease
MGVYSVLLGIGFIAGTLVVGKTVQDAGWRAGWSGLGWALVALGVLTWLLVRSTPEHSGSVAIEPERPTDLAIKSRDATLRDALLNPAFWIFSLAAASFGLIWSAITLFNESILEAHGFAADSFLMVMAILAGCGLLSNLIGGWLSLHWPLGRLMAIGMLALAVALGVFPLIEGQGALIAYALTLGLSGGLITVVYFTFYGRAFGRTHLGLIQGAAHLLSVVASALGPVLLTWCHGQTGSYDGMFLAMTPVAMAFGLAAWRVAVPDTASNGAEISRKESDELAISPVAERG